MALTIDKVNALAGVYGPVRVDPFAKALRALRSGAELDADDRLFLLRVLEDELHHTARMLEKA